MAGPEGVTGVDPRERLLDLDRSFLPVARFDALAQACVEAAVAACGEDVRGVLVHGSALPAQYGGKGGFIPGFSDFDCHVHLASRRMRAPLSAEAETALAMQRRFGPIQEGLPPEVWAIQLFCVDAEHPPVGWSTDDPGVRRVLYGEPPAAAGRPDLDPVVTALARLRGARGDATSILRSVCDKRDAGLAGNVRTAGAVLKGLLPHAATVAGKHAREVWRWALSRLVLEAADAAGVGEPCLAFWDGLLAWGEVRQRPDRLRDLVRHAVAAMDGLAEWAEGREG